MQVFWSKAAKQDRYDIALYISQESVDAACNMLDRPKFPEKAFKNEKTR